MSNWFESCHKCVAPKRHPGCHDTCPEHAREKAIYEEKKAQHDKERAVTNGIYSQRGRNIQKALRNKRRGYGGGGYE